MIYDKISETEIKNMFIMEIDGVDHEINEVQKDILETVQGVYNRNENIIGEWLNEGHYIELECEDASTKSLDRLIKYLLNVIHEFEEELEDHPDSSEHLLKMKFDTNKEIYILKNLLFKIYLDKV